MPVQVSGVPSQPTLHPHFNSHSGSRPAPAGCRTQQRTRDQQQGHICRVRQPAHRVLLTTASNIKPVTPEPAPITLFCTFLPFAVRRCQPQHDRPPPEGLPVCCRLVAALSWGEETKTGKTIQRAKGIHKRLGQLTGAQAL